jgi:hypothetical protein
MSHTEDTSPELERLRAAHREIADPDPAVLRKVREHVLSELAGRPAPVRRRPRARRLALAGALAAVLALVAAVSLDMASPGGGGTGLPRIDAVAQARAALLPPDAIAHYTVALSQAPAEGPADPRYADCNAGPLEVWRATDPTRWRAVQPVSENPACGTLDLSQGLGPVTAPRFEVAYASGRTEMYVPGRDLMLVINDENAPAEGERRAPSTAAGAASIQLFATPPDRSSPGLRKHRPFVDNRPPDLISDIEQMLARGELGDRGETTRDGRRVRVLTGYRVRGAGDDVWAWTRIRYVVDAATFAPISATSTSRMADSGASASVTARFADYERIALTRESAGVLEIDAQPSTRVIERTIEQIKNP